MYLNYINGTGHAHLFEKRNKFCAFGAGESENPLKKNRSLRVVLNFEVHEPNGETSRGTEEQRKRSAGELKY